MKEDKHITVMGMKAVIQYEEFMEGKGNYRLFCTEFPDAIIYGPSVEYCTKDFEHMLEAASKGPVCWECYGVGKSDSINVNTLEIKNRGVCGDCKGSGESKLGPMTKILRPDTMYTRIQ